MNAPVRANAGRYRVAGTAHLAVAAAGLGIAGFGFHEAFTAELGTGGRILFGMISAVVSLLNILPVLAARALFRARPNAAELARVSRSGCGAPLGLLFCLGLIALGRSVKAGEALTQTLPFLGVMLVAGALIVLAGVLTERAVAGRRPDGHRGHRCGGDCCDQGRGSPFLPSRSADVGVGQYGGR